ncbi:response regulator [Geobacter pelophilus]|uniref:Response regulator n=1 Tax=Geoanaerobacter pelophilus TaxID=60036 RepID=A0AAW4KYV6_9BACT|nr:response regulator [Geoanaerobacter pelophilus]MBT0663733.1 response regulator [Geoanaerobacter pelophilus]
MTQENDRRELWIMGLGKRPERGAIVSEYLESAGYTPRIAAPGDLVSSKPLGIVLDLSPSSDDGWGILLNLKSDVATRDIPVLPIFLSELGKVGGVFPVAGFFTLPIDEEYIASKLAVLGLTEDVMDYDLHSLVVTRKGDEKLSKLLEGLGFGVENAYTGKEALALVTIGHPYLIISSLMHPDMGSFELLERLRLYPQTRNIPFFILIKDAMKDGERCAMSREIDHLVRKKSLSKDEFLAFLRKRS